MTKPQLVLDIGGVLASNLSPLLWQLLAAEAAITEEALYSDYKQQISNRLWTGEVTEAEFWQWINTYAPSLTFEQARALIVRSLQPLPALGKVAEWSTIADIHLLSNHLSSWVASIIEPIKPYLTSITISSTVGFKKPDPTMFSSAATHFLQTGYILFVDDQLKNLEQAASHGWHTLLADEAGQWIELIYPLLEQSRDHDQS